MGRGGLHHGLAGPAGEGLAHVAHHLEAAWPVIEALLHVLAYPAQATAAGWAGVRAGMSDGLARLGCERGRPWSGRQHRYGPHRTLHRVLF